MCFALLDLVAQVLSKNAFLKKVISLLKNKDLEKYEGEMRVLIFKTLNLKVHVSVLLSKYSLNLILKAKDFKIDATFSFLKALIQFSNFD